MKAIADCLVHGHFSGFSCLRPAAAQRIWIFQESLLSYWYRLDTQLKTILQRLSDITTYELEAQLTSASIVSDVIANPNEVSPYRTRSMTNGIKQCRHYILWMANEYELAGPKVMPAELIHHPSNNGRFKEKTIRNTLADLRKRGLLSSHRHDGDVLTLSGRKELERLNAVIGLA